MKQDSAKKPQFSPEEMRRVLQSEEGKRLIALLSQNGGLQTAVKAFQKGDMEAVQNALKPALANKEAESLLHKINGK